MLRTLRTTLAGSAGTIIEFYDFFVYGALASTVFPKIFFPNLSPTLAILFSISTYAIGFVMRPIGAILFGYFGDRKSRASVLNFSLMLMGISTIGIGLLPTYESIGNWAAFFLLILRLLQGLAMGGEWGAAAVVSYENAPEGQKGFNSGLIQLAAPAGLGLSFLVMTLLTYLTTEEQMLGWAWRMPFLLSLIMLWIGSYIRRNVFDSRDFSQTKYERARTPVRDSFKHWKLMAWILTFRSFQNTTFHVMSIFAITYMVQHSGFAKADAYPYLVASCALSLFTCPLIGHLSDKYGRLSPTMVGCLMALGTIPFFFWGIDSKEPIFIFLGFISIGLVHDLLYAPMAAFLPENFPLQIRASAVNIVYNLGAAIAGVLLILMEWLYTSTHSISTVIWFLMVFATIALVGSTTLAIHLWKKKQRETIEKVARQFFNPRRK